MTPDGFYLGTHMPNWLALSTVPLFVSARRLRQRKALPVATCRWALDSGGFTELSMHGRWTVGPEVYAEEARRWMREIGGMDWAAIQDWMCEPVIREKTGLTVEQHQLLTIMSYQTLTMLAPDVPWAPVLQGWEYEDYMRHVEMYRAAGIDLRSQTIVGLGSVCRRQATEMAEGLVRDLCQMGIRLHAFGFKVLGLRRCAPWLASSDSMAWSFQARKNPPLKGCTHRNCNSCYRYAMLWRDRVARMLDALGSAPKQLTLFEGW